MKSLLALLRSLFQRDSWLLLIPVLLFAYIYMQQSQVLEWRNYLGLCAGLSLVSIPAIGWSWWVTKQQTSRLLYWLSWTGVFIAWPLLLQLGLELKVGSLPLVQRGLSYLAPGGGIELNAFWFGQLPLGFWLAFSSARIFSFSLPKLTDWNIHRIALFVVVLFAFGIVLVSNYFQDAIRPLSTAAKLGSYLWAVLQVIVIYGTFYLIYYIHHHYLFNQLLRKRGLVRYFLGVIGFLLLFVPLQNTFISWFPAVQQYKVHPIGIVPEVFDALNFSLAIMFFVLTIPFIVIVEWYRQRQALVVLEQEKTNTELQLLKQQINPHFFFNTLNNLYAMSLTQEKETPEVILKLSELMRYVIYKGQQESVSLQQEVDYLRGYLDLQKLRMHEQPDLTFDIEIEDTECAVPPLLFIILLENAFKHGIEPADGPTHLYLELKQSGQEIHFSCENSVDDGMRSGGATGIGLQNLKRRLEVRFPERHSLTIVADPKRYTTTLKLQL